MPTVAVPAAGGLPVDPETCFTDHRGRHKPGLEKKARAYLGKIGSLLGPRLEEGEVVRWVAPASSPYSILELLTTGWVINHAKRCLLVVTDRRILHLPTNAFLKPRGSLSQVRFGDLGQAAVKGFLGKELRLTYRDGGKETFRAIQGAPAKTLDQLLADRDPALAAPSAAAGREHLCPRCGRAMVPDATSCPACGLDFKSRKRALLLSLLVPGGGYFYTGHPVLGLFDALVEGVLLLMVVALVFAAVETRAGADWAVVGFFAGLLAIEKLITVYHANHYVKELLPADRSFRSNGGGAVPA